MVLAIRVTRRHKACGRVCDPACETGHVCSGGTGSDALAPIPNLFRTVLTPGAGAAIERGPTARLPLLTTVRAVHGLSAGEARRAYPVRVRAVVTYFHPIGKNLVAARSRSGSAPATWSSSRVSADRATLRRS